MVALFWTLYIRPDIWVLGIRVWGRVSFGLGRPSGRLVPQIRITYGSCTGNRAVRFCPTRIYSILEGCTPA